MRGRWTGMMLKLIKSQTPTTVKNHANYNLTGKTIRTRFSSKASTWAWPWLSR